jgi:hypothetical protein
MCPENSGRPIYGAHNRPVRRRWKAGGRLRICHLVARGAAAHAPPRRRRAFRRGCCQQPQCGLRPQPIADCGMRIADCGTRNPKSTIRNSCHHATTSRTSRLSGTRCRQAPRPRRRWAARSRATRAFALAHLAVRRQRNFGLRISECGFPYLFRYLVIRAVLIEDTAIARSSSAS